MQSPEILSLLGGALIGLAASLLLVLNGNVAGISGILGGALVRPAAGGGWRPAFLIGLFGAGFVLAAARPDLFSVQGTPQLGWVVVAGLLVGIGTRVGSGCTSGHGVCGMSRLSPRSILATVTFIATGVITVVVLSALGVSR